MPRRRWHAVGWSLQTFTAVSQILLDRTYVSILRAHSAVDSIDVPSPAAPLQPTMKLSNTWSFDPSAHNTPPRVASGGKTASEIAASGIAASSTGRASMETAASRSGASLVLAQLATMKPASHIRLLKFMLARA